MAIDAPQTNGSAARWVVKKAARACMAGASLPVMRAARHLRRQPRRIRVLTYHRFGRWARDPFAVTPEHLDRQMGWLAETGRAIGLAELSAFMDGSFDPPDDAVIVTIDDGFLSTLTVAAPILARHGIPAVAFISAGLIGTKTGAPERYLTASEMASLAQYGVTIGSHAWSHISLGDCCSTVLQREMGDSRSRLEDISGTAVTAFAYPFGTRRDYSDSSHAAAVGANYTFCFTSQHGAITRGLDKLELPRIKIEGGEVLGMLIAATRGGLDGWALVDKLLWRLQARGGGTSQLANVSDIVPAVSGSTERYSRGAEASAIESTVIARIDRDSGDRARQHT